MPSLSESRLAFVLLIGAVLSAVYVLPRPWGFVVVVAAVVVELGEKVFWRTSWPPS